MSQRSHAPRAGVVVAALVVAGLALAGPATAAPGDPDGGFGAGGSVGPIPGQAEAVIEAGGKILTVTSSSTGSFDDVVRVRRYLGSGAPDTTFSGDGAVDLATAASVGTAQIAVDGTGRVLVAAGVQPDAGSEGYRIWRLEADGDPDTTFDTDGTQTLPSSGGSSQVTGIGVQPDGDVLVGIADTFIFGGFSQLPGIVRLTSAGAVAQTVDVLAGYTERGATARMEVDAQGRPYVLIPDDGKLTLRRYTADALAVDVSYGLTGNGRAVVARPGGTGDNDNWGGALHVAAGGVALVAGTVGSHTQVGAQPPVDVQTATLVARITANGTLDPGFSGDGVATVTRPSGSISPTGVGPTASGGVAAVAWREVQDQDAATVAWELDIAGAAQSGFSGDGRIERSAWATEATVGAAGTRLFLLQTASTFTSSTLASVQLITPPPPTVPGAPAAPKVTNAAARSLVVSWSNPAASGGKPVTSYEVRVYEGAGTTPIATIPVVAFVPTGNFSVTATDLDPGTRYRFKVLATNEVGTGAASAYSGFGIPPFASADRLVQQQYTDFLGRTPTATELADLRARIVGGTTAPAAAIAEISNRPESQTLDAVTRIYYAFFGRPPDTGGLTYWLAQRRAGVKVSTIANQFVGSNEFTTRYGSLSNTAFVQLVYQNVLGRPGDSVGVASWTAKLESGALTRGGVMAQFSESGEHQRRRAGEVNTVSITYAMVRRTPTTAELTTWRPQVTATEVPLVLDVLGRLVYDQRVPGT